MDNLDITPAFIDVFERINRHLDLVPFQKLINDQNSTLTDEEKLELKTKINESAKKVRQLNLVLDELKDQLVNEIEKVQIDFEEKNRDLDALEEHLNYIRTSRLAGQAKLNNGQINQINVLRERTRELNNELNSNQKNNLFEQDNEIDQMMKKENLNKVLYQQKSTNLPKPLKSALKPPSHFGIPRQNSASQLNENNSIKKSLIKKSLTTDNLNSNNRNMNLIKNEKSNDHPPKKEKIKNVDNIYINYPQINYISLNEFNYIPKYMRGRLGFETCNQLLDEFNRAIETKYKFMMIPTTKYTNDELIKYTLYKNQEDDETKGLFFVTPKDLQDYSELKISMNNTKIFLQCIRHCKRIKRLEALIN